MPKRITIELRLEAVCFDGQEAYATEGLLDDLVRMAIQRDVPITVTDADREDVDPFFEELDEMDREAGF